MALNASVDFASDGGVAGWAEGAENAGKMDFGTFGTKNGAAGFRVGAPLPRAGANEGNLVGSGATASAVTVVVSLVSSPDGTLEGAFDGAALALNGPVPPPPPKINDGVEVWPDDDELNAEVATGATVPKTDLGTVDDGAAKAEPPKADVVPKTFGVVVKFANADFGTG